MTTEAPASLQRHGLRRAVHDRPADTRPDVSGALIWKHFAPELRARFLTDTGEGDATADAPGSGSRS